MQRYLFFLIFCTSCTVSNRLFVQVHPYYDRYLYFESDSVMQLRQGILYNRPGCIDEEHSYNVIVSEYAYVLNKKIHLSDTSCVHAYYDYGSVWSWSDNERYTIRGWIRIKSAGQNQVLLREYIRVRELEDHKQFIFKGQRLFLSKKEFEEKMKRNIQTFIF